jgi:hypothetical protein
MLSRRHVEFAQQTALLLASGWGPWAQEEALFSYQPDLDTTLESMRVGVIDAGV